MQFAGHSLVSTTPAHSPRSDSQRGNETRDRYGHGYRSASGPAIPTTAVSANATTLTQIRENALAISAMASLQIEHEQRLATAENRLDRAAAVVGELGRRVKVLEQRTAPGQPIGEEQAAEIS